MEWSNEKVLELLEFFAMEPSLWDTRSKLHKNRGGQNDAWRRIMKRLSFEASLEDLKRKKESLMGYYRIHLNKYKKSLKSAVGTDDVYKTNWFAFDVMDNFLRPIYISDSNINSESIYEENSIEETSYFEDSIDIKPVLEDLLPTDCPTNNKSIPSVPHADPKVDSFKQTYVQHEKRITSPEIFSTEKQINKDFGIAKTKTSKKKEELDEYDYFAGMIAAKIRKLENMDDREELMNSIQNQTFQFYMKSKNETHQPKQ